MASGNEHQEDERPTCWNTRQQVAKPTKAHHAWVQRNDTDHHIFQKQIEANWIETSNQPTRKRVGKLEYPMWTEDDKQEVASISLHHQKAVYVENKSKVVWKFTESKKAYMNRLHRYWTAVGQGKTLVWNDEVTTATLAQNCEELRYQFRLLDITEAKAHIEDTSERDDWDKEEDSYLLTNKNSHKKTNNRETNRGRHATQLRAVRSKPTLILLNKIRAKTVNNMPDIYTTC